MLEHSASNIMLDKSEDHSVKRPALSGPLRQVEEQEEEEEKFGSLERLDDELEKRGRHLSSINA